MCRDLKRMIDPMDEIKQKSHDFPVKKSWKCHPTPSIFNYKHLFNLLGAFFKDTLN